MLLEALGQALARGHVLLHAARDAAVLALGDGFRGEVVDAGAEAAVDEVAEELLLLVGCVSSASLGKEETGGRRGFEKKGSKNIRRQTPSPGAFACAPRARAARFGKGRLVCVDGADG